MNILVGVVGKPRAGKDSLADFLEKEHGFYHYAFADHLKWLMNKYFDIPAELLWGAKTQETRELLHNLGRLLTDLNPDILINSVTGKIKRDYTKAVKEGKEYRGVISDVRSERELKLFDRQSSTFLIPEAILASGVSLKNAFDKILVVKVERDLETILKEEPGLRKNINNPIETLTDTHSEWDYFIENNSSLDNLRQSVSLMVSELTGESLHDNKKG